MVPFCNSHSKLHVAQNWYRIDCEDELSYLQLFQSEIPTTLIHCAGICDVDKCEEQPKWAHEINVKGVEYLLRHLPNQTRLVYVSSDHVFGHGNKVFNESDHPTPVSIYGKTRVEAEQMISKRKNSLILRVGLPIGESPDQKTGHLDWLHYRKNSNLPLTVVKDEFRSVVWAKDLANRILEYTNSNVSGVRHITGEQTLSRLELAHYLNKKYKIGAELSVETRANRSVPHLGRVELGTIYEDQLSEPLPAVLSS